MSHTVWLDAAPAPLAILQFEPAATPHKKAEVHLTAHAHHTEDAHSLAAPVVDSSASSSSSVGPVAGLFRASALAISHLNPAACHWLNIDADTNITTLAQLLHPHDRHAILQLTSSSAHVALLPAYLGTEYVSCPPNEPEVVTRIGTPSTCIDMLLAKHGARTGTFITAWNPRSRITSVVDNAAAHDRLRAALGPRAYLPHVGRAVGGGWEEEGFLVFDWIKSEALEVARQFQQNAIVWVTPAAPPQLVWCLPDEPTSFALDVRVRRGEATVDANGTSTEPAFERVRVIANPAARHAKTGAMQYVCAFQAVASISPTSPSLASDFSSSQTDSSNSSCPSVFLTPDHAGVDGSANSSPPSVLRALPPRHGVTHAAAKEVTVAPQSRSRSQASSISSLEEEELELLISTTPTVGTPVMTSRSSQSLLNGGGTGGSSSGAEDGGADDPSLPAMHRQLARIKSMTHRPASPHVAPLPTPTVLSLPPSVPLPPVRLPPTLTQSLLVDYWSVMPMMFFVVLGGRFVYTSTRFQEALGWTSSELLRMHISELFHPSDVENMGIDAIREYEAAQSTRATVATDADHEVLEGVISFQDPLQLNRLRHKAGHYVHCMLRIALSHSLFGSIDPFLSDDDGVVGLDHATSSSRSSEPYVYAMARPMWVHEHDTLMSALDGVAHQKAEFISNISHELQTPMNGIVASSEMLAQTELSAEQMDYLNCIQISAEHMTTIISDIISFADIDQGRLRLEKKAVHLTAVLEEAITLCFRPKSHDHLEILHTVAPDLPMCILGDLARIRQILVHQLSNALKFTRNGHVQVRVSRYDGSDSPARLLEAQSARIHQLQELVSSGALEGDRLREAEEELAAPHMLVIQPPAELPSLHHLIDSTHTTPRTSGPASPSVARSFSRPTSSISANSSQDGLATDAAVDQLAPLPAATHADSAGVELDPLGASSLSSSTSGSSPSFLLQFAIEDTGIGIDARHSSRLFQIFSQADSSSSKVHAGTGIGLLTSLKLARAMGGDMWCSSVTGRGSVFYFTIAVEGCGPVSRTPIHAHSSLSSSTSSTATAPPLGTTSSANTPLLARSSTPLARVRGILDREGPGHLRRHSSSLTEPRGGSGSEFDSPITNSSSGSSPHRSPLVFPRFIASFQRVGVVDANPRVGDTIAADLRARGAAVRTFVSCAAALAHAESSTAPMDCWIIDALSGTRLKSSAMAAHSRDPGPITGEISGVDLVDALLALRVRRQKLRSQVASGSQTALTTDPDLKVVLLVQSFGLPSSLPLADAVLRSNHIRLIQVHKPYKHQVLYDAIRALADQLVLPPSAGLANPGLSNSHAFSIHQGKARRTLTLTMPMGDNATSGSVPGGSWGSRRIVMARGSSGKYVDSGSGGSGSAASSDRDSFGSGREFRSFVGGVSTHATAFQPSTILHHQPSSSPPVPPSPFVHYQLNRPTLSSSDGMTTQTNRVLSVGTSSIAPLFPLESTQRRTSPTTPPKKSPRTSDTTKTAAMLVAASTASSHTQPITQPRIDHTHFLSPASTPSAPTPTPSKNVTMAGHRAKSKSASLSSAIASKYPLDILVVEDNAVNMKIVLKVLSKLGYQPDTAVDGEEAHKKVRARADAKGKTYDVVLLDLQMPVMDGYDAAEIILDEFGCCNLVVAGSKCIHHTNTADLSPDAWFQPLLSTAGSTVASTVGATLNQRAIAALAASPSVPGRATLSPRSTQALLSSAARARAAGPRPILIALTANTSEEDRLRCLKVGFDEFVAKPISIADLVVPLRKWGKRIREQRNATAAAAAGEATSTTPIGVTSVAATTVTAADRSIAWAPSSMLDGVHHSSSVSPIDAFSPVTVETPEGDAGSNTPTPAFNRPALRAMTSLDTLRNLDLAAGSSDGASRSDYDISPRHMAMLSVAGPATAFLLEPPTRAWDERPATAPASHAPTTTSATAIAATSGAMPPLSPRVLLHTSQRTPNPSSTRLASRQLAHSSRVVASQNSPLLRARTTIDRNSDAARTCSPPHVSACSSTDVAPIESIYTHSGVGTAGVVPLEGPLATRVHTSPSFVPRDCSHDVSPMKTSSPPDTTTDTAQNTADEDVRTD